MNILERRVENQIQFWSLLGPFAILLSLAVLLFKLSHHWVFPFSALIGIPLCLKWKLKGMAAALSCLFAFSTMAYFRLEMDERYWHVGMGLATAFSFIVLTLSFEEVEGLISHLQMESQSRLENFTRLDEKWKGLEQEWFNDKEKLQTELSFVKNHLNQSQEDKQTFYKLAQLAKDEGVQLRTQHHQLIQDLLYKKQQLCQLHERLEENEATIQNFVNSETEQKIQKLHSQLNLSERDKEQAKEQIKSLENQNLVEQQQKEHLQQTLKNLQIMFEEVKQKNFSLELLYSELKQQHEKVCQTEDQHLQTIKSQQDFITETEKKQIFQEQYNQTNQKHQFSLESSLYQQTQLLKDKEEKIAYLTKISDQFNLSLIQQQADTVSLKQQLTFLTQTLGEKQVSHATALTSIDQLKQKIDEAHQQLKEESIRKEEKQQQVKELTYQVEKLNQDLVKERTKKEREKKAFLGSNSSLDQYKGLYLQLKEQFKEKSSVLETTRKELFHTQEKLTALQKTQKEKELFEISLQEEQLYSLLIQLQRQNDEREKTYQVEINDLYDLIHHLFKY